MTAVAENETKQARGIDSDSFNILENLDATCAALYKLGTKQSGSSMDTGINGILRRNAKESREGV